MRLPHNIPAAAAAFVIVLVILMALLADLVMPFSPAKQNLLGRLMAPSWLPSGSPGHWFGTDDLGRDILSRVIIGSRVSVSIGITAVLISGILGTVAGLVAGYFGGVLDQALMRLADIQLAFPSILLALAILAVLGPGFGNLLIVLGVTGWVSYARVIRAQVLSLRSREYVVAARSIGAKDGVILFRHILPNAVAPLIVVGTLQVASVIIAEASLSYLGVGVTVETVTWGGMLNDGQLYLGNAWWMALFPGLAIILTVLSINLLGDYLRDLLDPRIRRGVQ